MKIIEGERVRDKGERQKTKERTERLKTKDNMVRTMGEIGYLDKGGEAEQQRDGGKDRGQDTEEKQNVEEIFGEQRGNREETLG